MKVKLKCDSFYELKNDKGYFLRFQTQYGEPLSAYVSVEDYPRVSSNYLIGNVYVLDVVPVSTKTGLSLKIALPGEVSDVELF